MLLLITVVLLILTVDYSIIRLSSSASIWIAMSDNDCSVKVLLLHSLD